LWAAGSETNNNNNNNNNKMWELVAQCIAPRTFKQESKNDELRKSKAEEEVAVIVEVNKSSTNDFDGDYCEVGVCSKMRVRIAQMYNEENDDGTYPFGFTRPLSKCEAVDLVFLVSDVVEELENIGLSEFNDHMVIDMVKRGIGCVGCEVVAQNKDLSEEILEYPRDLNVYDVSEMGEWIKSKIFVQFVVTCEYNGQHIMIELPPKGSVDATVEIACEKEGLRVHGGNDRDQIMSQFARNAMKEVKRLRWSTEKPVNDEDDRNDVKGKNLAKRDLNKVSSPNKKLKKTQNFGGGFSKLSQQPQK
jgi:hypothetical protein